MKLALAALGFVAALTGCALAQTAPTAPAPAAPASPTATPVLTGDRIDGVPVISKLNTGGLETGVHRYWFRAGDTPIGQGWYVPVVVVKGARPGPRFLAVAGMHGDELAGIAVLHELVRGIDPAKLSGTFVALPGVNTPGLMNSSRNMATRPGGSATNLNRIMPGDPASTSFTSRYAGLLWRDLMAGQADFAVDLHTQSTGTLYPAYVFADVRNPVIARMAEMLRPDMIKIDSGDQGILETTLSANGIPAVTYELGGPQVFDARMVALGVRGMRNVMIDRGMLEGTPDLSGPRPYTGNRTAGVFADVGGYATVLVPMLADVKQGQPVAQVADPFGRVLKTYAAPMDGRVASLSTDPLTEPGNMLVRLLVTDRSPECKDGC